MQDIFSINNFPIIQDDNYYYFFRALNKGDNNDIENGITSSNGTITSIRPDLERFEGVARYSSDSTISLEEVFEHIKIHNAKDTNCISLSTSPSVAMNYGRENYNDTYVLVKIPKEEFNKTIYNAGEYMISEINKRMEEVISQTELDSDILEYFSKIDNASSQEELNKISSLIFLENIDIENSTNLKQSVRYRVTETTSLNYQSLSNDQNLYKNKTVLKLQILQKNNIINNIIPGISNGFLLATVGGAFSSAEFIHYKEISQEKVRQIPSSVMDMFSLLEQLPEDKQKEANLFKLEIIKMLETGSLNLSNFSYNDFKAPDLTIEEYYELTNGQIGYKEAKNLYEDIFYLVKSKLRVHEAYKNLERLLGNQPEFMNVKHFLKDMTFGIEPKVINRQSNKGKKLTNNINLVLQSKREEVIEWVSYLTVSELEITMQASTKAIKLVLDNLYPDKKQMAKEEYYLNAIIDSFDWKRLNIEELSVEARTDIIEHIKNTNSIDAYHFLKESNMSDQEISNIILTCLVKKKSLANYIPGETFTIGELETFIGYYRIANTKIRLKDYQGIALKKINNTLREHNFSACVLPTGAGKSFVALAKMLENPNQEILYLAPNNEILEQLKTYIVEYVHGKSISKNKDEIVKEVFPNLTLATYSSLDSRKANTLINKQYDLIVLDELHRTGAPKWYVGLEKLLLNQTNAKVLGITATPERDVDKKNMSDEIAKLMGYTEEEVLADAHISYYMDLFEAISLGYVVNPKVVECEYMLEQTGYITGLLAKINLIKSEEEKQKQLEKLDILRKKIHQAKGVEKIFQQNLKQGGKYIVFLPASAVEEILDSPEEVCKYEKLTGEQKIAYFELKLQEYLKNSGLDCAYYSMLSEYSNRENEKSLNDFENDCVDNGKTKFMIVIDKLNEGVHVKNVDGLIWFRAIDESSKILFLQQLGRIIHSIEPSVDYPDEKRPIAIDLTNNVFRIDLSKTKTNNEKKIDSDLLSIIIDWYENHGNVLPNINSTNKLEARYAKTLIRIKNTYQKYYDNSELINELKDKQKTTVKRIIQLGKTINLWEITLDQEITNLDSINTIEITNELFEITGQLRDFKDFETEVDNIVKDEKLILYIELLTTGYKPRRYDGETKFPGTDIPINFFWYDDNQIKIINLLTNDTRYQSPKYDIARRSVNDFIMEHSRTRKIELYIELLTTGYKPISRDRETKFPGTDIPINYFWYENQIKIINFLTNETRYQSPKYDIARRSVNDFIIENSITRKIELYIELLNTGYKPKSHDKDGIKFPGTDILVGSFWTHHKDKTIDMLLNDVRYQTPKYDTAKRSLNNYLVDNSPECKIELYIELLKTGYIPKNRDKNGTKYPGTDILISTLWTNYKDEVIETLFKDPRYQTPEYDHARNNCIIVDSLERKIEFYIELLKTGYIPKAIDSETKFPGTDIHIKDFWLIYKTEIINTLLHSSRYQTPEYEQVKQICIKPRTYEGKKELYIELLKTGYIPKYYDSTTMFPKTNEYVKSYWSHHKDEIIETLFSEPRYQTPEYDLAKKNCSIKNRPELKIELYIELLKTGYIPKSVDTDGTKFPGTEELINTFWFRRKDEVINELLTNPLYQTPEYDLAKKNCSIKNRPEQKIELYIELLNTGYIPKNEDKDGTKFPGTDVQVNTFWAVNKTEILNTLSTDPRYQSSEYEIARKTINNYTVENSTEVKIKLYIELLKLGYIPKSEDKDGTKFPGTDVFIKQCWSNHKTRIISALSTEACYQTPEYKCAHLIIDVYNEFESLSSRLKGATIRRKLLELSKTNEVARKIALYNGWLQLEEAKQQFNETSEFANAQQLLNKEKSKK